MTELLSKNIKAAINMLYISKDLKKKIWMRGKNESYFKKKQIEFRDIKSIWKLKSLVDSNKTVEEKILKIQQ